MANITIQGSTLGTPLMELLNADAIQPGTELSYQLCKTIYLYHPLGAKIAEKPVKKALSQPRTIKVPAGPEVMLLEAFYAEWKKLGIDANIINGRTTSRIYGASVVAAKIGDNKESSVPLNLETMAKMPISFSIFDPLNVAGSLVLDQNPNSTNFQMPGEITVQGQKYHPSCTRVLFNEQPVYIAFTTSSFGYVGRSAYQRALFPLKSFVQSMITDDMVTKKAGLLVAMMKSAGSIIDSVMMKAGAIKRNLLKEGMTSNVLQIGVDEKIETLNMMNTDNAMTTARKNILENIASAVPMPAKLLNDETYAEGFGEGTEDAKEVAEYIDGERIALAPLYEFFDPIVQYRAWNEEFYARVQREFPEEYGEKPYKTALMEWINSFTFEWPSLLKEPESERVKVDEIRFKAIIEFLTVILPQCDPDNKARVLQWAADNFNAQKLLFANELELDYQAMANYTPPQPQVAEEPSQPKPAKL
jgi:Anti-CBASS Acb1-like protein